MDYRTFRNVIEYDFLKDYDRYQQTSYVDLVEGIQPVDIIHRKELMFQNDSFLFRSSVGEDSDPFSNERFRKMFSEFQMQENIDPEKFSGILITPTVTNNCFAIHYQNPKLTILYLLANKRNPIVRLINRTKREDAVYLNYNFEAEYHLVKVSDIKNHDFNSKENFKSINHVLLVTRIFPVVINHKAAIKQLRLIEKGMEQEKTMDFLLDGI